MTIILNDTEDMAMLRHSARKFLGHSWPAEHAVAFAEDPKDVRRLWREIAAQGWIGIGLGSDEAGLPMAALLMEELGRSACPAPLADAILARAVLSDAAGESACAALADNIADGKVVPAWVFGPDSGEVGSNAIRIETRDDGTIVLDGHASFVEHAGIATHIFVVTGTSGEIAIVEIAPGSIDIEPTIGLTSPALANITFNAVRVPLDRRIAFPDTGFLLDVARLLLSARACGAASRGLDLLSAHAKEREQFGKKIGQFQAIQHKLANCLIGIDTTRLAVMRAAGTSGDERDFAFASAHATACRTLRTVVMELHHGFGGIGFWNDHEMPRHFRRIHSDVTRLGGMLGARRRIATALFAAPAISHRKPARAPTALPDIDLGTDVNALRQQVREWLARNWKGHAIASNETKINHIRANREFSRKLGEQGWLSLSWPKAYGGAERPAVERLVLEEELAYADAPVGWHNTSAGMIAPTLIAFGSEHQKAFYVPAIGRGEIAFSLGYSEPAAGSDLASLTTTATPDGDSWIVRGQKTFISTAGFADYCWLAARTGSAGSRHRGISVFIMPLKGMTGLTIHPIHGLNGHDSNTLFLDNLRLPADALVGEVNGGWSVITTALAHERATLGSIGARARGYYDRLVAHVASHPGLGGSEAIRDRLAGMAAEVDAGRLLAIRAALAADCGDNLAAQAAILKVYASELMERVASAGIDMLGPGALLSPTVENNILDGSLEYALRDSLLYTIGGGTNEIQRSLIALRALGMPR